MSLRKVFSGFAGLAAVVMALASGAGEAIAAGPRPWEWNFQPAASTTMERVHEFNTLLLIIIIGISLFVCGLIAVIIYRFREKKNPTPSKTSHNTVLEVIWTVVPIMILVIIAIPSFKLLYFADRNPNAQMTIKATGHQWYWSYDYPDNGDINFDALLVQDKDLKPGQKRLLQANNEVVMPVNTPIRILTTSTDVIHSWAVPAFGVKLDAVPGRINETWVEATKEGKFYGQCSELCGVGHGYMPITVRVVSKEDFAKWVKKQKSEANRDNGTGGTQIATGQGRK